MPKRRAVVSERHDRWLTPTPVPQRNSPIAALAYGHTRRLRRPGTSMVFVLMGSPSQCRTQAATQLLGSTNARTTTGGAAMALSEVSGTEMETPLSSFRTGSRMR